MVLRGHATSMGAALHSRRVAESKDILRGPPEGVAVGASVLGADFARLGDDTASAIEAGCELLHVDVMDGHFVPNLSMGPAVSAALRRAFPKVSIDVHLMVTDPAAYIGPFGDAGADHLTLHAEATHQGRAIELAERIRSAGMTAGLSFKPGTDIEPWLDTLAAFDLGLVMSVEPGFAGQSFLEGAVGRLAEISSSAHAPRWLSIDGGVGPANATACREAGCNYLVAASSIFGVAPAERAGRVRNLRGE